jgi:hypothetical protein
MDAVIEGCMNRKILNRYNVEPRTIIIQSRFMTLQTQAGFSQQDFCYFRVEIFNTPVSVSPVRPNRPRVIQ